MVPGKRGSHGTSKIPPPIESFLIGRVSNKYGCQHVKILSYNPGHDGAIAFLQDARLMMSIESEKDSNYRYSYLSIAHVLDTIGELEEMPEVICMGGWWPRDQPPIKPREFPTRMDAV